MLQLKYGGTKTNSKSQLLHERKEKIKRSLKVLTGVKEPLNMSYDGLLKEGANNEAELIELIKKLSKATEDCKRKMLSFAIRQGQLLMQAKETFKGVPSTYRHIVMSSGFTVSYTNFLISLFKLITEFPRLNYCSAPIRLFKNNMNIIR